LATTNYFDRFPQIIRNAVYEYGISWFPS